MAFELRPRIVVIGVGGAGGNAVNNMIEANLQGVEFVVANTDAQALTRSRAPVHIRLGVSRTSGMGAGGNPDVGMEAAKESAEEIKKLLQGAHMCFIAAGMGGGTGTGAAPIIARIAKEQKVLTVGVVTKPFDFEGKRRMQVAEKGITDLRGEVDTLLIIPNQNLFRIADSKTTFAEAFSMADRVLYAGVRGITDLMVMPGLINLDFADVRTVMAGMGSAMMGEGEGEGEDRAVRAAQLAISNPLLDDVSMRGARGVLINITGGYDMTLFEVDAAANEIRREVDVDAHIILGSTFDETMNGRIRVSVVAAGLLPVDTARTLQPVRALQAGLNAAVMQAQMPPAAPAPAPLPAAAPAEAQAVSEPPAAPADVAVAPPPVAETRPAPLIIRPRAATEVAAEAPVEPEDDAFVSPAPAPEPSPAPVQKDRSISGLFGWKTRTPEEASEPAPAPPAADEALDQDLEIPAFLRRSGNS